MTKMTIAMTTIVTMIVGTSITGGALLSTGDDDRRRPVDARHEDLLADRDIRLLGNGGGQARRPDVAVLQPHLAARTGHREDDLTVGADERVDVAAGRVGAAPEEAQKRGPQGEDEPTATTAATMNCAHHGMPNRPESSPATLPSASIRNVISSVNTSIVANARIRTSQTIHAYWSAHPTSQSPSNAPRLRT